MHRTCRGPARHLMHLEPSLASIRRLGFGTTITALISAVCLCVLRSRGPGPAIYGPKPFEFTGFGVTQGSKPYKSIGFAWDRFVCPRRASVERWSGRHRTCRGQRESSCISSHSVGMLADLWSLLILQHGAKILGGLPPPRPGGLPPPRIPALGGGL